MKIKNTHLTTVFKLRNGVTVNYKVKFSNEVIS